MIDPTIEKMKIDPRIIKIYRYIILASMNCEFQNDANYEVTTIGITNNFDMAVIVAKHYNGRIYDTRTHKTL